MLQDITPFLGDTNICVEKISTGSKLYKRNEVYNAILSPKLTASLTVTIQDSFIKYNSDSSCKVFLIDELDPEKITKYLKDGKFTNIDEKIIYFVVCDQLRKAVNKLYRDLTKYKKCGEYPLRYMILSMDSKFRSRYERKYKTRFIKRTKFPYKNID
ncbi:MAG: hypothetical protein ACLRVU_09835 [Beduini sp.]|uniref:hypothetical protein n=1 Tax=Beduini sp. TaxID=1922300 RepID=UPI0039A35BFD